MSNRYLKVIKNFTSIKGCEVGKYLRIKGEEPTYFITEIYGTLSKLRLEDKEVELMPKGFNPETKSDNLTIDDLVEGEIYTNSKKLGNIFMWHSKPNVARYYTTNNRDGFSRTPGGNFGKENSYRLATKEESKWLKTCIKQDKFIKKEDLDLYDDVTFELKSSEVKPKFIIGKWYKNIKEIGWYSKFKALDETKNRFEATEYINSKNNQYKYSETSWFYLSDGHELLTDLTEIQSYLPEGHVDKIVKEETPEYVECIESYFYEIPYEEGKIYKLFKYTFGYAIGTTNGTDLNSENGKKYFKPSTKEAYEAYEAYEAQFKSKPMEEDLTGRYLKALRHYPNNTKVKKGEYEIIANKNHQGYLLNNGLYACNLNSSEFNQRGWELMPKGWTPESDKVEEFIKLDESHVGKYISLKHDSKTYSECLVVKEGTKIYLCNNSYENNNGHSDKSVYKYSLLFFNWEDLNSECFNIKLLSKSSVKVEEWIPQVGDKIIGKSGSYNIQDSSNSLGVLKEYFIADKVEKTDNNKVKLWSGGTYWLCNLKDISLYKEEIPTTTSKEPDKDELLRIAKEKYPSGTRVKGLKNSCEGVIVWENHHTYTYEAVVHNNGLFIGCDERKGHSRMQVYYNGQWAEIISTPKQEVKSESSIPPPLPSNGKWCIKISDYNKSKLQSFYETNIKDYDRCLKEWSIGQSGRVFVYPGLDGAHTYLKVEDVIHKDSNYKLITQEQFDYWVLGNRYVLGIDPYESIKGAKFGPIGNAGISTKIKNKPKGFNEEEYNSNPFNQVLVLPKKSKQIKKQLILT